MDPQKHSVLVVGSGYHSQILGPAVTPLTSWSCLLKRVAKHCGIKSVSAHERDGPMDWERLVMALVERGGRTRQANAAESELREAAQTVLRHELSKAQSWKAGGRRAIPELWLKIQERMSQGGLHLVSLNFDGSYPGHGGKVCSASPMRRQGAKNGCRKSDLENVYRRRRLITKSGSVSCIWHPHGILSSRASLRLGLRDYGLAAAAYAHAFSAFKAWQSSILGKSRRRTEGITQSEHALLLEHLRRMDCHTGKRIAPADHWITRFMLLPVDFIGVGLSREESSLRWLIVQRRRNAVRMEDPPAIRIHRTLTGEDLDGMVEIVRHPSHNEAWEAALCDAGGL